MFNSHGAQAVSTAVWNVQHVAKLTLQLAPPLTSSGFVLLQFLVVLLPISTMLLPVMPAGSSSEIVATVLSRGGAYVSPTIMSSSTSLEGRTIAINS
jgi:hypothetical protein